MTKEQFNSLVPIALPERVTECFEDDLRLFRERGAEFLSEEYIHSLNEKYKLFPKRLDFVLDLAAKVSADPVASLLSFLLARAIERKSAEEIINLPAIPSDLCNERTVLFEMAAFFAILSFADEVFDFALRVGMPESVALDTVAVYEGCLEVAEFRLGRTGFLLATHYGWNQRYINHSIFKIGVLNYELLNPAFERVKFLTDGKTYRLLAGKCDVSPAGRICGSAGEDTVDFQTDLTETEEYFEGFEIDTENALITKKLVRLAKPEWQSAIKKGEWVLCVHIPRGADMSREKLDESYRTALSLIGKCFPDIRIRLIHCHSWLLDPALRPMLREGSGILRFQSDYLRYPTVSAGNAVFSFLFGIKPEDLNELPETTSLQRSVKRHYLDGGFIHEVAGIIPIEKYIT